MSTPASAPLDSAPQRPEPPPSPLGPGSLGRGLLIRMVLLITLIAVGLSAVTLLATRESLLRSVDRQLEAAFVRQDRRPFDREDLRGQLELPPGQPAETIVLSATDDWAVAAILTDSHRGVELLRSEATDHLLEVPPDGEPETIHLYGYGTYRAMALPAGSAVRLVALPLAETEQSLRELIALAAALTLAALIAAFLLIRSVVVRSLEPLNRLASTANEVSRLELSRGEVVLPVRVAQSDADPRTEVGRVGHALNHMLGNVEGALSARQASETQVRQFVADASHELRNPLASIRGYAELGRRERYLLPPNAAHALDRVQSEADRMSRLVEDMLLLARLDSHPDLDLQPVDVNEIVLNATSDAQAANPEHDWGVDLPSKPVRATADVHRLHQVVANLLANAGKHTPPGTEVTTAVRAEGTDVVITVVDNGPGIPEGLQDHVFERFTRADVARTRSGAAKDSSGLGLAIVAAVMDAHGGSASVDSRPGRTVFTLRLPWA